MKNFRPRSFTRGHAALIIVLSLAFLGLFSIFRSSAQEPERQSSPPGCGPSSSLENSIMKLS